MNATLRCTHCHQTLHPNDRARYACRTCEHRATTEVQALPALYKLLEDALHPGSPPPGARVRTSRTAPLPAALQPLTLRGPGGIVSALLGIEQRWRIHLDWDYLPHRGSYEASLQGTTVFLTNNIPWACDQYEPVSDDLDLIHHLTTQATNAITGHYPHHIHVTCRTQHPDGTECGAPLPVDLERTHTTCHTCGTRWTRQDWATLYQRDHSHEPCTP